MLYMQQWKSWAVCSCFTAMAAVSMTHGYKAGWHKGYSQGKNMQCDATIEGMTAMFGEDMGWEILEKLNDYYRMKGWTK